MYGTTDELARILKITNPSIDQVTAMTRVLTMASVEIDKEIDLDADTTLTSDELLLVEEVALERAQEHWRDEQAAFGILGLGDTGPIYTAKNSWERYAFKLAPIKDQWGIA